jgi:hypothetical protein
MLLNQSVLLELFRITRTAERERERERERENGLADIIRLPNLCFGGALFESMLQDGRFRVQFLIWSLDFSVYLILPAALWPRRQLSF